MGAFVPAGFVSSAFVMRSAKEPPTAGVSGVSADIVKVEAMTRKRRRGGGVGVGSRKVPDG